MALRTRDQVIDKLTQDADIEEPVRRTGLQWAARPRESADDPQGMIDKLEQKLRDKPALFDWGLHNELRHLYAGRNERKSLYHPEYTFVSAACWLKAAELLSDERARSEELLRKVINLNGAGLDQYRAAAKSKLQALDRP